MELSVNIKNKYNTQAYWEANDFVPLAGELVFYSDIDKCKIGIYNETDETTKIALSKLPFIGAAELEQITTSLEGLQTSLENLWLKDQSHFHSYDKVKNAYFDGDKLNYTSYKAVVDNHTLKLNQEAACTTTESVSGEITLSYQTKSTTIDGSNISLEREPKTNE